MEGPSDAAALLSFDLPDGWAVLTSTNGAEATGGLDFAWSAGKQIILMRDHDKAGGRGGPRFAREFRKAGAASVHLLRLYPATVPQQGQDVRTWLNAGHTIHELVDLIGCCPAVDDAELQLKVRTMDEAPHQTDLGNARRLVALHGPSIRYCHPWGKWLCWDGARWRVDDTASIERLAKDTVRKLWYEAADEGDEAERKRLAAFAAKSEATERIGAMIRLARSEEGVPVLPDALDADPWLLNCPNGTIDLRAGQLREHRREDHVTKLCPTEYHPQAEAPRFHRFLDEIFDGSRELIDFVQRLLGYCLTGSVAEQVLPIFWGDGQNGKSTLLNLILRVMGRDYAIETSPDLLIQHRGDRHPTELTDFFGKRLATCIETEENRRLRESLVKMLTGGEPIRAHRMREDNWEFWPTHKIVLAGNHKPEVRGTDTAIWRRLLLVPFTVFFPVEKREKGLPETLASEAPGILAWCVWGCLDWQRYGLGEPIAVHEATEEYRQSEDVLGQFLNDCCTISPGNQENATALLNAYHTWAGDTKLSQRRFGEALRERGFDRAVIWRKTFWIGIGLRRDFCPNGEGPKNNSDATGKDASAR